MIDNKILSPKKEAIRLCKIAEVFHGKHGTTRFPVDVDQLALGCAEIYGWDDPIVKLEQANILNFEGMLSANDNRSKWMIVYNSQLRSEGRIRFTKAHELGHYILHREMSNEFECTREDMLEWSSEKNIEAEADNFASYLLMPLDDFRKQATGDINLDLLGHCADRYGVSLTATILKWLSYTTEKAILVMSRDGYMDWATSSEAAFKAGAFFRTRKNVIPIPIHSLTANSDVGTEKLGVRLPISVWFPHLNENDEMLEMKIFSENYDSTLTLLIFPQSVKFWPSQEDTILF